jgi:hypothetical protein
MSIAPSSTLLSYFSIPLYIRDVHCVSDGLEVFISNAKAFDAAQKSWSNAQDVVMITTDTTGCSTPNPGPHTYWHTTSSTFVTFNLAVHVVCYELPMNELFKDVDMDWGTSYHPSSKLSNSPGPIKSCGRLSSKMTNGLPVAACGVHFDQILDAEAGYISDDINLLPTFAPGLMLNSRRAPGGLVKRGIFDDIGNAVKGAANGAVKAVGDAANTVAKGANGGIRAIEAATVVDVPPISFDFLLAIAPPSVDKSPIRWPSTFLRLLA